MYLFPALGDAVLLAPAVRALLDLGARVDLLLRPSAARIWRHVDLDVRVFEWTDALDPARLADEGYDVAVDLTRRFDADGRPWVAATNAAARLGWIGADEPNPPPPLTFGTVDHRVQSDRHWSRMQTLPLRCLGVREPSFEIGWRIEAEDRAAADAMWTARPRIVVVPGAREARKLWRPGAYAKAGAALIAEGADVVVVGAPQEAALIEEVAAEMGARAFTGPELGRLLALIEGADAVLSNDTGPLHLAYLSDTPTVAIFTRMPSVTWGPPHRSPRHILIRVDAAVEAAPDDLCGEAMARAVTTVLERTRV